MQQIEPMRQIEARAQAIGVTLKRLAGLAGLSPSTLYRSRAGGDMRHSTLRRLDTALAAEEARLRAHLGA